MPPSMKAISQDILGGPEVLRTVEAPRPTPRTGQVLVRMCATSVNPVDCKLRAGVVTHLGPPPFTLGFDLSGTVVEIGPEVESFQPGDEVFGMIFSKKGAYGEFALANADTLALRPANLDPIHAGVLPTAALTAWQAINLADVHNGERVLIHAAAGGVGHLAVQFAHRRGAHVIGTARTVNHNFLRALGADELVDYTESDFAASVQEVDAVIDLVGGAYGSRSLRILRADGRYIDAQARTPLTTPATAE